MKRKNEFLYEFIYEQLANGVKRTFVQIDEIAFDYINLLISV